MKFQPTIAKQGLLLITIPLIFEIIFVSSLWALLRQASQERTDIGRSREFVAQVMGLTKNFLDAGISLGAWKTTKSDEFIRQFDAIVAALPKVYEKLDLLSAGDARRQSHVAALKTNGRQILELTGGFRKPSGLAMLLLMDPVEYRHKLSHAYEGFMSETSAVTREERERENLNPAREERVQTLFSWTLLIGVIFNIAISFLMVRLFSRKITRRLIILTGNCRRFAERKQLHEPVGGHDEIADLDLHIHEMADEVRSAEQMRDQYVQMVNHDLRAPLAAIQTILAGTLKGLYGELTDKGKSRISDAREDATRLLHLINETMDADRLESGQFQLNLEKFNLADLINAAIASLRPLVEKKQMAIDFAPTKTPVLADRPRLHRVVANLLDNAVKYGPAGSTIEIAVNSRQGEVIVEITDEGSAIESADAERLFKAYERGLGPATTQKPGKGLGLAICKAIIEAHEGSIGVKSRGSHGGGGGGGGRGGGGRGGGNTFWFAIPSD
jgi:signal transduction histidine kinase